MMMKVHFEHGGMMAARISAAGARIIEQAGVIASASYHGTELPYDGHALRRAEEAAQQVVEAIAEYRRTVEDDPVITWPRPASHGRGASRLPEAPGMRASHMLPLATLDALNGAGPDRAGWADAFNTHEADGDDPEAA